MATATLSLLALSAGGARPKTRRNAAKHSPRNPNPKNPKPRNPRIPPTHWSGGDEATSYARLPPKDDFFLDPSLAYAPGISSEIKLRESKLAMAVDTVDKKNGSNWSGKGKKRLTDSRFKEGVDGHLLEFGADDDEIVKISQPRSSKANFLEKRSLDQSGKHKKSSEEEIDRELSGFEPDDGDVINLARDDDKYDIADEELMDFESDDEEVILGSEDGFSDSEGEVLNLAFESDDEVEEEFDGFLDGDEELEGGERKEKGVPAVMRCFDTAKIYVKAGDGGNGVVAFRREKFVPYGGPSGGDGGRGGNVYVEVEKSMNSLLPFRKAVHFRAERGAHGQGSKQAGAKGEDVVVKVASGTVIREARKGEVEGEVLLELLHPGQRALLLPGGRGGRGNAAFKSGTNKVPKIAEKGEKGAEMWLDLELKLVADVGIVGAPNAGKSTLLSAISAAQPTIANYPFTTLLPNLGVVSLDFDATMVVADLPGLLEGAHRGFGLGHEFLRHTERCSVLVHVVDGSGEQPEYEFDAVRLELELFSPELAEKPYIVVYNKIDLPEASGKWMSFKEHLENRRVRCFCISALNRQGTHDVVCASYEVLQRELEARKEVEDWTDPVNLNHVADAVNKQRSASMNEFEIFHDNSSNTWHVVGAGIQRFVQMTNWQYTDSMKRFQHALEACGVNKSLIKRGVKEGDTVIVGEMEMIWHNETNSFGPSSTRKRAIGSVKWRLPG